MTTPRTCLALVLTLLAIPAFATDPVIPSGIDTFHTDAATTFANFALDPIPADFFCPGSRPFAGRIPLRGEPIATFPEGALGNADTIFMRLDDAVFDKDGVANTRIQFKALSLVSIRPIKNQCGSFDVAVTLEGEQPISDRMTIVREGEHGGYFLTEFDAEFRITFTPVEGWMKRQLVFVQHERMRGVHTWTDAPGEGGLPYKGNLLIDTDADGQPDTEVSKASNFAVGWGLSFEGKPILLKALSNDHGVTGTTME